MDLPQLVQRIMFAGGQAAAVCLGQIQLFQIGIPAFTGLYFDWFGGCIQAFIFCTLTAIFIKRAAGED